MSLFTKKEKKEDVPAGLHASINPDAKVYSEYNMGLPEKIVVFIVGALLGAVVGFVFYDIIIVAILFGVGIGLLAIPIWRNHKIDKQTDTLKLQFKALLESVSTSLGAGRNVVTSFQGALADMKEQFNPDAYIIQETEAIVSGLYNSINIETLLLDLANRSGIDDIQTFADVFDTCYRKGGNIKDVIASTYKIINDKIEIEMEIKTMVSSANAELNMMCAMPVVFVLVLNSMGSNITGRGTVSGYISTTIALGLFLAAYFLGRKIMSIKL